MRTPIAVACAALLLVLAGACGGGSGGASSTPGGSPVPTPLAGPSGKLNAQVPMPAGFPADVPVYPGSRLTSGAAFVSSGQASWGMEWETLDTVAKVQAFYASKMNQGDWAIAFSTNASGSFAATFKRKSTTTVSGTLVANSAGGVTRILMSLVSASG